MKPTTLLLGIFMCLSICVCIGQDKVEFKSFESIETGKKVKLNILNIHSKSDLDKAKEALTSLDGVNHIEVVENHSANTFILQISDEVTAEMIRKVLKPRGFDISIDSLKINDAATYKEILQIESQQ